MTTPLQYDISVVGFAAVDRQLSSLEKRFARHNAALERQASKFASSGTAGKDPAIAAERKRHSMAQANIRAEAATKAAEERKLGAMIERSEKNRMREASKAATDRVRSHERAQAKQLRQEQSASKSWRKTILGAAGSGAGKALSAIGTYGSMALGIGGGMLFHQVLEQRRSSELGAVNLANTTFLPRGERQDLTKKILAQSAVTSRTSGFQQDQVIGAMRSFQEKAGEAEPGMRLAGFMTDVADATGADLGDIGSMSGQIYKAASLKGLKGDELEKTVKQLTGIFAGQGMGGQIEIKDFASLVGSLTATAGGFSGDFAHNAQTLGAMAQMSVAGGGAVSPAEAMTAVARFRSDIANKGGNMKSQLHKSGIDPYTDKTRTALKAPEELLMAAVEKTHGSLPKITDMFGERSWRAVEGFRGVYAKAADEAGGADTKEGHAAGMAAMREQFDKYMKLGLSEGDVSDRAEDTRGTQAKRMDIMMRGLEEKFGPAVERIVNTLIPAFEKLVPTLEKAAGGLASFIEFFAAHPWVGLGAIIGASMTKEIASAGIGKLISDSITGEMGGLGTRLAPLVAGPIGLALAGAIAILAVGYAFTKVQGAMPGGSFGQIGTGFDDGIPVPLDWDPSPEATMNRVDKKKKEAALAAWNAVHSDSPSGGEGARDRQAAAENKATWQGVGDDASVAHKDPVEIKGGEKFENAANSMNKLNALPAQIDNVFRIWSIKGPATPNRGSDPTVPKNP